MNYNQMYIYLRHLKHKGRRWLSQPSVFKCPKNILPYWDEFQNNGLVVIPDFCDTDQCSEMIQEINHAFITYPDFVQVDSQKSDHRLFGIETQSLAIQNHFSHRKLTDDFVSHVLGHDSSLIFTLGAKLIYREKNLGSGAGWHRDSYSNQFKSILYLTDVNEKNGPFQFVKASHKISKIAESSRRLKKAFSETRYSDENVEDILKAGSEIQTVTGKAGTLVIANTTGLHRGAPIQEGTRYALTNYYWYKNPCMQDFSHFQPYLSSKTSIHK